MSIESDENSFENHEHKDLKEVEKAKDMHYDLAFEINDSDNEVPSGEDDERVDMENSSPESSISPQKVPQKAQNFKAQTTNTQSPNDIGAEKPEATPVKNAYNPEEFANLQVNPEIKELFQYIQRYKPHVVELETKVRPFVPDYIAAVGEVDAFLKVQRPDNTEELLGITVLDEPKLNQSDPVLLEPKLIGGIKKRPGTGQVVVRSIENADKNPKKITQWINTIAENHRNKPSSNVVYSKPMPDSEALMDIWHPDLEKMLNSVELPGPDADINLFTYIRMACAILGIPVHNLPNKKSLIESLHVLFTLYSDFKENQHFRQDATEFQSSIKY